MKSGTARKRPFSASMSGESGLSSTITAKIAVAPPSRTAKASAASASSSVAGRRSARIASTSRCSEIDVPKSPRSRSFAQTTNWTGRLGVEAVMRAQRCDVRGRSAGRDHHGDRIAGHDAHENEDDDRDADQRDGGHGQTIGRAGDHSPREREREREIAPGSRAPRAFTPSTPKSAAARRCRSASP